MGENKAEAPTLPRNRYMSSFDSTHAPVATAVRAADTGLVSMSTRPDIPGMLHLKREACDEIRLSVEFVTVGFLGICRQYCCH